MPDIKISQMDDVVKPLTGNEVLPIVQDNNNAKISAEEIKDFITKSGIESIEFSKAENSNSITISTPNGLTLDYDLKLPNTSPFDPSTLISDGSGNLEWARLDPFSNNRIYVNPELGLDQNDGVNQPVKTLKKGLQLASALSATPTTEPSDSAQAARILLERNIEFIKNEIISYVNYTFVNFFPTYDIEHLQNFLADAIDAVVFDVIFDSNYQISAVSKIYHELFDISSDNPNTQQRVVTGLEFAKNLVNSLTGIGSQFKEDIDNKFDVLILFVTNSAQIGSINYGTPNNIDTITNFSAESITDNVNFILAEQISWIDSQISEEAALFASPFSYNRQAFQDYYQILLEAVIYNVYYGGNEQTISAANAIFDTIKIKSSDQILQFSASIDHLKTYIGDVAIALEIVNTEQSVLLQQIETPPAETSETISLAQASDRVISLVDIVLSVLNEGNVPIVEVAEISRASNSTGNIDNKNIILNSITTTVSGVIDKLPGVYDANKYTELFETIITAATNDFVLRTNFNSIFQANNLTLRDKYSQLLQLQKYPITESFNKIKEEMQNIASSDSNTVGRLDTIFENVISIIEQEGSSDSDLFFFDPTDPAKEDRIFAKNSLLLNKEFLIAELATVAGNENREDTRQLINSLAFDMLYTGNTASIQFARSFFTDNEIAVSQQQFTQIKRGLQRLTEIIEDLLLGKTIVENSNFDEIEGVDSNQLSQNTSQITSELEAERAKDLVNLIILILENPNNSQQIINPSLAEAAPVAVSSKNAIIDQKITIIDSAFSFIDSTFTNLDYNETQWARKASLASESVIFKLFFGGNDRIIDIATRYINLNNNQTIQLVGKLKYLKDLIVSILKNETIESFSSSQQEIILQLSAADSITDAEVAIDTIIDILQTESFPTAIPSEFTRKPITVIIAGGDFYIDNPVIVPDNVSIVGDSLRSVILRPLNANKDMLRLRNSTYVSDLTFRDAVDSDRVPVYTFNFAVAFDDVEDEEVDRSGYFALSNEKPIITVSPYTQNLTLISFLGANGVLVDGSKVRVPNKPSIPEELESPVDLSDGLPEQGKSMVSNAFTMISFGGTGWLLVNDAYAQIVSCFQIFMDNGVLAQSGGYVSITNSATNFGTFALRSNGFSQNSFEFDRGTVVSSSVQDGAITLTTIGTGREPVAQYVLQVKDANTNNNITQNFKNSSAITEFDPATSINLETKVFTIEDHGLLNGAGVVYNSNSNTPISGLIDNVLYFVQVIDQNTVVLFNDNSLRAKTNITGTSTGTHRFISNLEEFFIRETVGTHNSYQELALPAGNYAFVAGQTLLAITDGFENVAFVQSFDNDTNKLIVSNELSLVNNQPQRVLFNENSEITSIGGTIQSTPIPVQSVEQVNNLFTSTFIVDSTITGNSLQNTSNLLLQKLHFHRPSIVNSSAHTWEFAGSGNDYNALPQNGGISGGFESQQFSELPGRVYASGTNELGDFQVGNFIIAENRTGNITFRTRVTVGEIAVLRLSLSDVDISEFSIDTGLGDNEPGGAQDSRISTQRAIRSFIANRLGNVLDRTVSTNAVAGAVVQLNSQGQINQDLLPPLRGVTTFNTDSFGGRLLLSEQLPPIEAISGDNASETYEQRGLVLNTQITWDTGDIIEQQNTTGQGVFKTFDEETNTLIVANVTGEWDTSNQLIRNGIVQTGIIPNEIGSTAEAVDNYFLRSDASSQFLILRPDANYDFTNINVITGANSLAQGSITEPVVSGVLVAIDFNSLQSGSMYSPLTGEQIYNNVPLSGGNGTGAVADITVNNGEVVAIQLRQGGEGYQIGDTISASNADIGGTGSGFSINVSKVETRLFIDLVGSLIRFSGTDDAPEFTEDATATVNTISDLTDELEKLINARDASFGGDLDYATSTITIANHSFSDGDPVAYNTNGNLPVGNFTNNTTYFVKVIDNDTIELFTNYAFSPGSKLIFGSEGTGSHKLIRFAVNVNNNSFVLVDHGFNTGDVVRFSAADTPEGITSNSYYFVGSVTINSFTLHLSRNDAIASVDGNTILSVTLTSTGTGSADIIEQNVEIIGAINTSSRLSENWGLIAPATFDASNIVSGTIVPSRLASNGTATDKTFLRGDSRWANAVQNIKTSQASPITLVGDFLTDGGTDLFFNSVSIDVNKANDDGSDPNFSTVGVASFSRTQFDTDDGRVTINAGTIDAGTLGGQSPGFYVDPANLSSVVPISRGGTSLSSYSTGDILFASSQNTLNRLSIGSNGSFLTSNGSVPEWSNDLIASGNLTVQGNTVLKNTTISASNPTSESALDVQSKLDLISPNGNSTISLNMLNNGALAFVGESGQLFSVVDSLEGIIFSVNNADTMPYVEVDDAGTILLAPFEGKVGIGTQNPTVELDVDGSVNVSGVLTGASQDFSVTISSNEWTGSSPHTVTKSVPGILSGDMPFAKPDFTSVTFANVPSVIETYDLIYRIETSADDEITFYALSQPNTEITQFIKVIR